MDNYENLISNYLQPVIFLCQIKRYHRLVEIKAHNIRVEKSYCYGFVTAEVNNVKNSKKYALQYVLKKIKVLKTIKIRKQTKHMKIINVCKQ